MITPTPINRIRGFITTLSALATLIIGLIISAAATYLMVQHQQNRAYSAFISEAQELQSRVERIVAQSRRYQLLYVQLLANSEQDSSFLAQHRGAVNSLEILQMTESGYVSESPPGALFELQPANSILGETNIQETLAKTTITNPILLSPHIGAEKLTGQRAEIMWLIRVNDKVYSIGADLTQLLEGVQEQLANQGLKLMLFDLKRYSSDPFLTLNAQTEAIADTLIGASQWRFQNPVQSTNGEWLLQVAPRADFTQRFDSQMALVIFIGGTLISLLSASLVSHKWSTC